MTVPFWSVSITSQYRAHFRTLHNNILSGKNPDQKIIFFHGENRFSNYEIWVEFLEICQVSILFREGLHMERNEQGAASKVRLRTHLEPIPGSRIIATNRHGTPVSIDIVRERNQAKRLVVEWKKCDIYVFQKNKNCVGLVETIKTMEISKKKWKKWKFWHPLNFRAISQS